jgi:anti-sigma factor RsiW
MDPQNHFMQDKINAMVDGQLPPEQQAEVLARLASDPLAQETHQAWRAQREALRALHRTLLDEAVPPALQAATSRVQHGRQQLNRWSLWGGMAAAVVLAFGMGWLSHGQIGPHSGRQMAAVPAASAQAFVQQAALAHAVYSPELRHPVEVPAAQQEHLVQWLSKRLGKPLKVPVLTAQGYELVGGRLLPGEGGARAQFMFQNPAGQRLTLYLGAVDATTGSQAGRRETAFRYSAEGPVPSFYWVDQGFGYALSAAIPREELMKLAELVYRQL